jgi:predicted DsbA family dithiol-disulfide isomerase
MTTLPKRAQSDVRALLGNPVALVIALMILGGSALGVAFFPREEGTTAARAQAAGQDKTAEFEKWYTAQPRREIPVPADGAAVVIVKFNDYQCPPCKQTYMDYKGILAEFQKKHPGKVKFVTKDYPLDPECNASAPRGNHIAACEAAVAVRLARRNNRDHALEDWLFANQSTLTPDVVKTAAKEVGGVNDFDAQYQGQLQAVKADIALGGLLGVEATPTFYINGVLVKGGLAPQYFQSALDFELSRAK